jgi:ABC-type antimicrobial peptide transport system permease subunit
MIWPSSAAQLSLTKLKTRKVRLFITIFISSILFAIILAASMTMRGAVGGVEKFSKAGFGNRYISRASSNTQFYDYLSNSQLIAQAQDLQKNLQAQKTAEAKRLGITYDPKSDVPLVNEIDSPGGKIQQLNLQAPQVTKLVEDFIKSQAAPGQDFNALSKKYGSTATYSSKGIVGFFGPPYLQVLKAGQENFDNLNPNQPPSQNGIDSLSTQWQVMSGSLIKPFLLKDQNLKTGADGSVPIIAPFSAVEQILGLKPLPSSASSNQQLDRLKLVRSKAAGYAFEACYRNGESASEVQAAVQQQQDITRNKSQKDFVMPDLVKDRPSTACGPVVVTRDKRSADDKALAAKQDQFDRDFGKEQPFSQIIKFRIVGLNSDINTGSAISVRQIFSSVLSSTLGIGWFSPIESADINPVISQVFNVTGPGGGQDARFAEFPTGAQLKKFMDDQNCQPDFSQQQVTSGASPFQACEKQGKYYSVQPFGSSSAAIDELKSGFSKVFKIAAIAVAGLAALIMMGTVGRIIADSRRETAVFRAIGAKRLDIAQIYFGYALMLAGLIFIFSFILGLLFSSYLNHRYSEQVTIDALLAFNVSDLSQKIVLTKLYAQDLFYVLGLIIAGGLAAAVFPILNNVRRNPIRDMRDER